MPTRTALQIRTHSQKYFAKTSKGRVFPEQARRVSFVKTLSSNFICDAQTQGDMPLYWCSVCARAPVCMCACVPEHLCACAPMCRCACVPVHLCAGAPVYLFTTTVLKAPTVVFFSLWVSPLSRLFRNSLVLVLGNKVATLNVKGLHIGRMTDFPLITYV